MNNIYLVQRTNGNVIVSIMRNKSDNTYSFVNLTSVIARSVDHYGEEIKATVCMEECAELIQAISKEKRGKSTVIT